MKAVEKSQQKEKENTNTNEDNILKRLIRK